MSSENSWKIAKLNDEFRQKSSIVNLTRGLYSLENWVELLATIRKYDDFTEDNDPYGEHDFGSLDWFGEKVYWKIDYYDKNLEYGEDPLSSNCRLQLTVMLAGEY